MELLVKRISNVLYQLKGGKFKYIINKIRFILNPMLLSKIDYL